MLEHGKEHSGFELGEVLDGAFGEEGAQGLEVLGLHAGGVAGEQLEQRGHDGGGGDAAGQRLLDDRDGLRDGVALGGREALRQVGGAEGREGGQTGGGGESIRGNGRRRERREMEGWQREGE